MRHDLFIDRKSVHIKLKKEVHAALRERLFRNGLTMQDLFNELAEMALTETPQAERIFHRIAKKKLAADLDRLSRTNNPGLGEFDNETLYNLLEEHNEQGHEQE